MNRVFQKIWNSRFGNYLLPLFFCIGNLANFIFFYMGLAYEENIVRKIGFIIINVFYAITAFAALLSALRKNAAALAPAADCGGAALCRVLFDLSDPVRVLYIVDL